MREKRIFLHDLSTLFYSLNKRNFSVCARVSMPITADVGCGTGRVSVAPGCVGCTNGVGRARRNVVGCAVRMRYPTVPFPKSQCTDAAYALRYPFKSVK